MQSVCKKNCSWVNILCSHYHHPTSLLHLWCFHICYPRLFLLLYLLFHVYAATILIYHPYCPMHIPVLPKLSCISSITVIYFTHHNTPLKMSYISLWASYAAIYIIPHLYHWHLCCPSYTLLTSFYTINILHIYCRQQHYTLHLKPPTPLAPLELH